ncbi:MAG: VOC family protein [Asticcacaulis sp.]
MGRVTGIGGVFFQAEKPAELGQWYRRVLGLDVNAAWNGVQFLPQDMAAQDEAKQVFAMFSTDSGYFKPSVKPFMINLCVDNIDEVLAHCASQGVEPVSRDDGEFGRFAHIIDPEGTKIELWQPA